MLNDDFASRMGAKNGQEESERVVALRNECEHKDRRITNLESELASLHADAESMEQSHSEEIRTLNNEVRNLS